MVVGKKGLLVVLCASGEAVRRVTIGNTNNTNFSTTRNSNIGSIQAALNAINALEPEEEINYTEITKKIWC